MADSESKILREYYLEKDFIFSLEGILKVFSVMACIVVGVLGFASRGACARGGGWLADSAGSVALAAAALLALLTAAALVAAPHRAPLLWLYSDVISSSVIGVLLVVVVILSAIFCQFNSALIYVYLVLGVMTVLSTTGSAAVGYAAAMRSVDAARPQREPRQEPPSELDV